jgi:CheY-like chemotaxis protein
MWSACAKRRYCRSINAIEKSRDEFRICELGGAQYRLAHFRGDGDQPVLQHGDGDGIDHLRVVANPSGNCQLRKCIGRVTPGQYSAAMVQSSRILVVEDEPLVAETIASALGDKYQVQLAASAAAATDRLQAGRVDLMLLDCLLPGGQLGEVIAQADALQVPLVLMSGDLGRIEALEGGRRPFLGKPFTIDALLATVAKALGSG